MHHSGTSFTMFTKLRVIPQSAACPSPSHRWAGLTFPPTAPRQHLSLSRPKVRCTSKLKTKMVIHMRSFIFSHCRCLNGPRVELQEISRLKQQKKRGSSDITRLEVKPPVVTSSFTTLVSNFPRVKYRLYITSPSFSCSSPNSWLAFKDD